MKTVLQGWNLMRIVRLVLAAIIVAQGIAVRDTFTIVAGVVFGGMAIANIGCCGIGRCAVNQHAISKKTQEIE